MPTSDPGSSRAGARPRRLRRLRRPRGWGFTLIEVIVVLAIIAIGVGVVSLALRDPAATRLERDAQRLAVLLEMARAESRATGLAARWMPVPANEQGVPFRFIGLRAASTLPERWLDGEVSAQVVGGSHVLLGPDAILPPQRVVLALGEQRLEVASDGLAGFAVVQVQALP